MNIFRVWKINITIKFQNVYNIIELYKLIINLLIFTIKSNLYFFIFFNEFQQLL